MLFSIVMIGQQDYTVYVENNYIFFTNRANEDSSSAASKDVVIIPEVDDSGDVYYEAVGLKKPIEIVVGHVFKEDDTLYTEAEWIEFYTRNTSGGFNSASGGSGAEFLGDLSDVSSAGTTGQVLTRLADGTFALEDTVSNNIFTPNLSSDGSVTHVFNGFDTVEFNRDNAQGSSVFNYEFGDDRLSIDTRGFAVNGTTVVSRSDFEINPDGFRFDQRGNSQFFLPDDNGVNTQLEGGFPRQRVSSQGQVGANNPTVFLNPSIIKVEDELDFTTNEPTLGIAIAGNYYWNTTANATFQVGLYAAKVDPDFLTLSGFLWELQTDVCNITLNGQQYLVEGATRTSLVGREASELFRELDTWAINDSTTEVSKAEILGNVEVVGVSDNDTLGNRSINKETDLPIDGPRYVHFRVRLNPSNTHSVMMRSAFPGNASEIIVNLDTGQYFVDQSGSADVPVVIKQHITSDFAEFLVEFEQMPATVWQIFPATGPNTITNRTQYNPNTTGTTYFEFLDTNAPHDAVDNPLYSWFNRYFTDSDNGGILPYYGAEGFGVELRDTSGDNYLVRGDTFQVNESTFGVQFSVRKETESD